MMKNMWTDTLIDSLQHIQKNNHRKMNQEWEQQCLEYLETLEYWLQPYVLDILMNFMETGNSAQREFVIRFCTRFHTQHLCHKIEKIIPVLTRCVSDASPQIRRETLTTLRHIMDIQPNRDIDPFIPILMKALEQPLYSVDAIHELSSCIFVQDMTASTLAIMIPILKRGLRHSKSEVQRKSCVILENICRLVVEPSELRGIMSDIYPILVQCSQEISHPEARQVAERVVNSIGHLYDDMVTNGARSFSSQDIHAMLQIYIETLDEKDPLVVIVTTLCESHHFEESTWYDLFSKYSSMNLIDVNDLRKKCRMMDTPQECCYVDEDTSCPDLYRGQFSLAYGTLTLLKNCQLHLKKNRFYGLLGPNNCGKTTLMRAMDREQLEGFPKKSELKAVFVEHEIQERKIGEDETGYDIYNTDLCGREWIVDYCHHVCHKKDVTSHDVEILMHQLGFGHSVLDPNKPAYSDKPVTTYSGGWKMKMQLCAATLVHADLLMLDEPTGHLDVTNVAWLKHWLTDFMKQGGSVITTSHDSSFLNDMCTHIIDFQKRKLITFQGSLTAFVEKYPEKSSYFELKHDIVRFTFPEPGYLEGVKSISKSILKMNHVTYQYPTRDQPTVMDISLECSRISRVSVVGPNGAGKSTAIKLLIGELSPTEGTIQKHPNLRIAYVAQHAFHHLEKHITKTPSQYIMWRFAGFEDKESIEKIQQRKEKTTDDTKEVIKYFLKDNVLCECRSPTEYTQMVEPEVIHNRHENKKEKTKEYEVQWRHRPSEWRTWVSRDILCQMGAEKLVQRFDEKMAMESGMAFRSLTTKAIEEHFSHFGIDAEQASHTMIRSLSGGQKIKVVMAAAFWMSPHLVILDEPTNYLDRDSLGALTKAIHDYQGGVIIISHNKEFANAVSQETWIMEKGRLHREGESIDRTTDPSPSPMIQDDKVKDSFGNDIHVQKHVSLSTKEIKQELKKLQKLLSQAKKNRWTEDQILDCELKIEELKEQQVQVAQ